MLPLSFAEYCEMTGKERREAWNDYFCSGGFSYAVTLEEALQREYLSGIYHTVLLKDIVERKIFSCIKRHRKFCRYKVLLKFKHRNKVFVRVFIEELVDSRYNIYNSTAN